MMSQSNRNLLTLVAALALVSCKIGNRSDAGKQAYQWTEKIVSFGPRNSGGQEIQKVRDWIEIEVRQMGFALQKRPFTAKTPKGFIPMINLSYVIPGEKHESPVILLAHYDSKIFADQKFLGANDAASSVALLMSLSPYIQKLQLPFDVEVFFVDGEEAIKEWKYNDSLYGSRQLAQDVRAAKVKAVIVVDMISDKDLKLIRSRGIDAKLLSYLEESLNDMDESNKLDSEWSYVMDDHTPFIEAGIPTLHLMDFTFGDKSSPGPLWHTDKDTMENVSADSLSVVGEAILRVLKKIP